MPERKRPANERDPWFDKLPERFEAWAGDLGTDIAKLKIVGSDGKTQKKAPNLTNRATRMRMREGLAFEVRHDLYSALSKLEDMSSPTSTGKLMMGVEDWTKIGRMLAALSPIAFEKALAGARAHLEKLAAVAAEGPDFEKKETPPVPAEKPRKPAKAISRAAVTPPSTHVSGEADELPWERAHKKVT